jgi:hypothetical protein
LLLTGSSWHCASTTSFVVSTCSFVRLTTVFSQQVVKLHHTLASGFLRFSNP